MSAAPKRIEAVPQAQPAPEAPAPLPQDGEVRAPSRWRRRTLMFSVPLLLAAGGGYAWVTGGRYITTDNAYVQQPMVPVSADVAGRIVEVDVAENQRVEAGQPIFRLDPEPFRIALEEADAALAGARLSVAQLRSAYGTAEARLEASQAILEVRQRELDRQESLADQGAASSATLDEATLAARTADNDVTLAREAVDAAAAALGGDPEIPTDEVPSVQAALASREAAARNLDKTLVLAPVAGLVAQVESLNEGQYVAPGTMVASVVETADTWIEANFKETQLATLQVGQPVDVEVDAYPDATLHGTVESLGSATGSQFSLIPARNATGNWVKVVQRLPVRISIDADPGHPLRGGMSVNVSVDSGHSRLDDLR